MVSPKETIKNLAKKARLSQTDVEKMYQKVNKEMKERGFEGEKLEKMTLARMQVYLKKRFTPKSGERFTGYFRGVENLTDFAEIARNKLLDQMRMMGLQEAVKKGKATKNGEALDGTQEEVDEFISEKSVEFGRNKGYLDEANNLIYVTPAWKRGQIIPDHEFSRTAFGVFEDKEGKKKFTTVSLYGDAAAKVVQPTKPTEGQHFGPDPAEKVIPTQLPLFKPVELSASKKKKGQKDTEFMLNCYNIPELIKDEFVDAEKDDDLVKAAYPDRVLDNLSELSILNTLGTRVWGEVSGNVVGMSVASNGNTVVDIDDLSLQVTEEGEVPMVRVWFDSTIPVNLADDALDVKFVISTYSKRDGSIGVNGLGYWCDPVWRQSPVELEDDEVSDGSADDTW